MVTLSCFGMRRMIWTDVRIHDLRHTNVPNHRTPGGRGLAIAAYGVMLMLQSRPRQAARATFSLALDLRLRFDAFGDWGWCHAYLWNRGMRSRVAANRLREQLRLGGCGLWGAIRAYIFGSNFSFGFDWVRDKISRNGLHRWCRG